jgi:cytochrome c oxidase subunit 3
VAWAVALVKVGFDRFVAGLLSGAALSGVSFLGLKGYEYWQEYHEHLVPGVNFAFEAAHARGAELFFMLDFVLTSLHAVHVTIGIVVLLAIARAASGRAYGARYHAPVTVTGLYWHFVDLVWIFLFALIYLPGRSSA